MLQIAYLGFSKPIVSACHLAYEITDEILVVFICYLNLTFSNYWPDDNVQARYIVGTSVNGIVTFHIIYHLLFMLFDIFATIYRLIRNVLRKGDRVVEIDKKVPMRTEKDLCYPFDKTEFSARDGDTVGSIGGSAKGGKKVPKKAIKSKSKGGAHETPGDQLATEKELFPYGHPKYIKKGKVTEKPDTIDEFSYEGTIVEDLSDEEEVVFEERVLLKNDDSEPATMDLSKFPEP